MPGGHRLLVGMPEDYSDVLDEFPQLAEESTRAPRFDSVVTDLVWLHGKNAPLLVDFAGSPLHQVLCSTWPTAASVADEWL